MFGLKITRFTNSLRVDRIKQNLQAWLKTIFKHAAHKKKTHLSDLKRENFES